MTAIRIDTGELKKVHARLETEVAALLEQARQRIRRTEEHLPHDFARYGNVENEFRLRIQAAAMLIPPRMARLDEVGDRLRTAIKVFEAVDGASSETWIHLGDRYRTLASDPLVTLLNTREAADSALADYWRYGGLLELQLAGASGFWLLQNNGVNAISDLGLRFIGRKEGFVDHLYTCPANCATIGYGHKVHNGPIDGSAEEAPFRDGITKEEALELLRADAARAEESVRKYVRVPLTQNQFDALVSFVFNLGEKKLLEPEILVPLNHGDFESVALQIRKYCWANNKDGDFVTMDGLIDRRNEEAVIFLEGTYPDFLELLPSGVPNHVN